MLYPPPFLSPLMYCRPKLILECLWTGVFGQSSSHGAWEAESGALFHCCSGESPPKQDHSYRRQHGPAVWAAHSSPLSLHWSSLHGKLKKWVAACVFQWLTGQKTALSRKGVSQMWRWDETPYIMHSAFLLLHTAHFPGLRQLHFNYHSKKNSEYIFCFKVQGF